VKFHIAMRISAKENGKNMRAESSKGENIAKVSSWNLIYI
jgi:hypothetical protein